MGLDHDEFGLNQPKLIIVIDSYYVSAGFLRKTGIHFFAQLDADHDAVFDPRRPGDILRLAGIRFHLEPWADDGVPVLGSLRYVQDDLALIASGFLRIVGSYGFWLGGAVIALTAITADTD